MTPLMGVRSCRAVPCFCFEGGRKLGTDGIGWDGRDWGVGHWRNSWDGKGSVAVAETLLLPKFFGVTQ